MSSMGGLNEVVYSSESFVAINFIARRNYGMDYIMAFI